MQRGGTRLFPVSYTHLDKMDIAELKAFRSAYERKSAALYERKPQLFQGDGQEQKIENNQEYHI